VEPQPWKHTKRGQNFHTCILFIRGFSHEDLKTRRTTETSQPSQSAALRQIPAEPLPHFPRQANVPNNLCSHRRPSQAVHPRFDPVAYSSLFQDALFKIQSSSIQALSSQKDRQTPSLQRVVQPTNTTFNSFFFSRTLTPRIQQQVCQLSGKFISRLPTEGWKPHNFLGPSSVIYG
jgi:hypothetical protein